METIAAIRSVSPDVPIIAMTAGARDMPEADDRNRGQDLHMPVGATATIAKPFRPLELFGLIGQCLDDARRLTT
jgi:CheY-like chemotaxis protein